MNSEDMIKAVTDDVVYNEGNEIKTLDGSVQANIVINTDDREYLGPIGTDRLGGLDEDTEQTNKLLDDEREHKREMYFRHSRILYPDKEDWVLSLAIDAFMTQEDKKNKSK